MGLNIPFNRKEALEKFYRYHERICKVLGEGHPFIEGLEKSIHNLESGRWNTVPMACIVRRLGWLDNICLYLERVFKKGD